ncbi:hypothetical protein [Sphingomonas sp. TDK1]|nr:hypothetical protein [Sphingomonas sp. TDK1]
MNTLAQMEKISMFRSFLIGTVSFGITSVMILGSGLQGSSLFG